MHYPPRKKFQVGEYVMAIVSLRIGEIIDSIYDTDIHMWKYFIDFDDPKEESVWITERHLKFYKNIEPGNA